MGSSRCAKDVPEDVVTNVRLFLKSSINDSHIMEEVVDFLGEAFCVTLNSIQDIYDVEALNEVAHMCWCQISDEIDEDVLRNLQVNENISRIKLTANSKFTDELGLFFWTKNNLTHLNFGAGRKVYGSSGFKFEWLVKILQNERLKYVDCRGFLRKDNLYCLCDEVADELKQKYLNRSLHILFDLSVERVLIEEELMHYCTCPDDENTFSEGMVSLTNDDFQNHETLRVSSSRYEKSRFEKVPTFVDFVLTFLEWELGKGNRRRAKMITKQLCDEKGWECLTEPTHFCVISDPRKIFPAEQFETTVLKHVGYEKYRTFYEIFETESKIFVLEGTDSLW